MSTESNNLLNRAKQMREELNKTETSSSSQLK